MTTCFDIFSPPPGDKDVISHFDRLSSIETKIAPRSTRIAAGRSERFAAAGMVSSRVRFVAPSLCQSSGRYPRPMGSSSRRQRRALARARGLTRHPRRPRRLYRLMDQGAEERQARDLYRRRTCAARGGLPARPAIACGREKRSRIAWPSPTPSSSRPRFQLAAHMRFATRTAGGVAGRASAAAHLVRAEGR